MASGDSGMEFGRKLHANISWLAAESMFHNLDLVSEILRRLPAKSLMRFKSVCKSWRALIISQYFCLLWQQHHQGRGILLRSQLDNNGNSQRRYVGVSGPTTDNGKNMYVRVSGPTTDIPQLEFLNDVSRFVWQSCNGFLLITDHHYDARDLKYWVYNPITLETVALPPPRMDACQIHRRICRCVIAYPVLAFDSHSNGTVVGLAIHRSRRKHAYIYQVCVAKNQGAWRSSCSMIRSQLLMPFGANWRNLVVWLSQNKTIFYDVGVEKMRFCDPPDSSMGLYFSEASCLFHFGESGGHLHFIRKEESLLIIKEMKHDLSGWFVKHNIMLSQIKASVFPLIFDHKMFPIDFLVEEEEEDSKLVLRFDNDVVLYRIKDQKSWKLCEWEPTFPRNYFYKFQYQHVETISRWFHDQH